MCSVVTRGGYICNCREVYGFNAGRCQTYETLGKGLKLSLTNRVEALILFLGSLHMVLCCFTA